MVDAFSDRRIGGYVSRESEWGINIAIEGIPRRTRGRASGHRCRNIRCPEILRKRREPSVKPALAVATELHRQLQPARAEVAEFDGSIAVDLVLHAEAPAQDLRQHSVVDLAGGQRPGSGLGARGNIARRPIATSLEAITRRPPACFRRPVALLDLLHFALPVCGA